jgi:TonB family protein
MYRIIFFLIFLFITNFNLFPNESCGLILITFCANTNSPPDTAALEEKIHVTADEMPKFGGREAHHFIFWLERNLIYPEAAIADSIQGKVYVQFVIDANGHIKDVKIAKGVHTLIDNEALRLVNSSTGWVPGKVNGKPASILLTFPVNFEISGHKRPNFLDLTINNHNEDTVYILAEVMPEFLGNKNKNFREYIAMNIRYPREALEMGIQGTVYVQFVINTEGDVTDAVVIRSAGRILDAEALRVILFSPKWEPGKINDRNVRVKQTFPVSFKISYAAPPKPPRNRTYRNN